MLQQTSPIPIVYPLAYSTTDYWKPVTAARHRRSIFTLINIGDGTCRRAHPPTLDCRWPAPVCAGLRRLRTMALAPMPRP